MRQLKSAFAPLVTLAVVAVSAAPALAAAPPSVTSAAATAVSSSGATLNGTVSPNGQATQYAFQWGPTSGYGHETTLVSAGSGTTQTAVSAALSGLAAGTTYHFRIIAFSAAGTSVGGDLTFATAGSPPAASPPPVVTTGSASSVTQSSAKLTGTVDPKGQATQYLFEYGLSSDYGNQTAAVSAGSGTATITGTASLVNLPPSATVHYRVVAYSAGGTALGSDHAFTTTTPPGVTTGTASSIDSSSATLSGLVNPQGRSTSYQFQFGTNPYLGVSTPPAGVGSGTGQVAVHQSLTGLAAGTTYYYRLLASSSGGISYGAENMFKTAGGPVVNSTVTVLAKLGFVAPRNGTVGIGLGCFGGQSGCMARLTLTVSGVVYAERSFTLGAGSGGFVHTNISRAGERTLFRHYHGPVKIRLNVTVASGQRISQVIQLARWY